MLSDYYYYFADLDDTLYPLNSGLANATHQNIRGEWLCDTVIVVSLLVLTWWKLWFLDYMVEKLGIEASKTDEMTNLLYSNYGTTLAGLRVWFPPFVYLSLSVK